MTILPKKKHIEGKKNDNSANGDTRQRVRASTSRGNERSRLDEVCENSYHPTPYEGRDAPETSASVKRRHRSSPYRTKSSLEETGYNSSDEYETPQGTEQPSEEMERQFEKALKEKQGFIIKKMKQDGACMFRAVADQVYGDEEMHTVVRKLCMDYMQKNVDYFSQYITEDFNNYIKRKQSDSCHGNHVEMQAMCEMFNRKIEVYQYGTDPINTFQCGDDSDNSDYEPIRLSYHGNVHYNSVINPHKPSVGVGLGLSGYKPQGSEKVQVKDAIRMSETLHLEQQMLEDKLRETEREATTEALEEAVARESYLQWLRDNEMRARAKPHSSATATCTSSASGAWWDESASCSRHQPPSPPRNEQENPPPSKSPRHSSNPSSPGHSTTATSVSTIGLPTSSYLSISSPSTSSAVCTSPCHSGPSSPAEASAYMESQDTGGACGETSTGYNSYENRDTGLEGYPPSAFGLSDWEDDGILAAVLAKSQQEYLDSLKKNANKDILEPCNQQHKS